MSSMTESSYPKGPRTLSGEAQHARMDAQPASSRTSTTHLDEHRGMAGVDAPTSAHHPGVQLDKTLSTIAGPMPAGPEKTPGGFGQVWRR